MRIQELSIAYDTFTKDHNDDGMNQMLYPVRLRF